MSNTDFPTASIIADLRQSLQPRGTVPYVGLKTAGAGIWLPFEFVQGCITQLERIVVLTSVGEKPTPLVRIAYHLLLDSAYLPPSSTDIIAKLKAALQPQGSAPLVGLKTAGAGIWLPVDQVQSAINELEKLPQRAMFGEPPTPWNKWRTGFSAIAQALPHHSETSPSFYCFFWRQFLCLLS